MKLFTGVEVAAGWAVCETAIESTTSFMETEAAGGAATAGPDWTTGMTERTEGEEEEEAVGAATAAAVGGVMGGVEADDPWDAADSLVLMFRGEVAAGGAGEGALGCKDKKHTSIWRLSDWEGIPLCCTEDKILF